MVLNIPTIINLPGSCHRKYVMKIKKDEQKIAHPLNNHVEVTGFPACRQAGNRRCGGEESRTPVQTYSPKAFYMLILF